MDFSRDGRRVLRAYANGRIEVWDVGSRASEPIAVLHNGGRGESRRSSIARGKYVVTGGDDGVARVWQVKPTRQLAVLRGHTDGVIRARFSPDGSQVATVSDDGSGRLWPSRPQAPIAPALAVRRQHGVQPELARNVLVVRRTGQCVGQRSLEHRRRARSCRCEVAAVPSVPDHRTVAMRPRGWLLAVEPG